MLKIGLPAGAEFPADGRVLVIVYAIARPFGAIAQAGFGIGFRIVQSAFLPWSPSPLRWRRWPARTSAPKQPHRVKEAFKAAAGLAAIGMLITGSLVYFLAARLIDLLGRPPVIDVGVTYLRVVAISLCFRA